MTGQQNTCLPCFTDNHDWCVRQTNLTGLDQRCNCTCPDDSSNSDIETVIAERAAARRADWQRRQTSRRAARAAHQAARQHGLQQRHARKTARQDTNADAH